MNDLPDDIKKQLHHIGGTEESVMGKPTPPQMPDKVLLRPSTMLVDTLVSDSNGTSYTRTDLCEKLKAALGECVSALALAIVGSCSCGTMSPDIKYHTDYCLYKKYFQALTKAQRLLR